MVNLFIGQNCYAFWIPELGLCFEFTWHVFAPKTVAGRTHFGWGQLGTEQLFKRAVMEVVRLFLPSQVVDVN